jgi:hypothetical protein
MANKWKISLLLVLVSLGSLPAQAAAAPSVLGAFGEQPAINQTRFTLLFDSTVENLTKDDFEVTAGCRIGDLEIQGATAQIDLVDCPTGLVTLTLLANSIGSSVLGPQTNHTFQIEIDATRPTATFSEIQVEGTGPFTYKTKLLFSEPVVFDSKNLGFASSTPCLTTMTAIPNGLELQAVCSHTELRWTLPARSLEDAAGHAGPLQPVQVSIVNLATPPPAPTPTPVPPPAPVDQQQPPAAQPPTLQPPVVEPTQRPTISDSAVASSSETLPLEIQPEVVVTVIPAAISHPIIASDTGESVLEVLVDSEPPPADLDIVQQVQVTDDSSPKTEVATVALSATQATARELKGSMGLWLIGIGSVTLIALGLARRFSGR